MDAEIRILEKTIEKILSESTLPEEVKRLVLVEQLHNVGILADARVTKQVNEQKEVAKDAESV